MFGMQAASQWINQARMLGSSLGQMGRALLGLRPRAIAPGATPMPQTRTTGAGRGNRPPRRPMPDEFFEQPPPEPPNRGGPPADEGGSDGRAGNDPLPYSQRLGRVRNEPETLTPQSSNVFSFSYDFGSSTLFVSYKATAHVGGQERTVRVGKRDSLSQRVGGHTAGKLNQRGPTYGYRKVPVDLYESMKRAASKGKFVWDKLRERGTIHGHQYEYYLAYAEPGANNAAPYIPRKASATGFRSRSLAEPGSGRRGFRTSTLPEQKGFANRTQPRRGTR
jgi:hypothetical protein